MLDHLQPGMRIEATGPAGIFTLPRHERKKYLFISAGSGITPSLSMTTYLYDRGLDTDVVFVSCARRPPDIIARQRRWSRWQAVCRRSSSTSSSSRRIPTTSGPATGGASTS